MKENNLPPFYVGQKVVAVEPHECFKIGDTFTVTGIYRQKCKCGGWVVSVGIAHISDRRSCLDCRTFNMPLLSPEWTFKASRFAPIESQFQSISFKEVVEIESPLISVQ